MKNILFLIQIIIISSPSFSQNKGTFIDSRDNKTYKWVKIDSQIWMAENLAYLPRVSPSKDGDQFNADEEKAFYYVYNFEGNSVSEAKSSKYYKKFGVLYNYKAATESCPDGWHLPSTEEWKDLEKALGMPEDQIDEIYFREGGEVGKKLKTQSDWEQSGNGNNKYGFSILPGGLRYHGNPLTSKDEKGFSDIGIKAHFWSSTPWRQEHSAYRRSFSSSENGIKNLPMIKNNALSVRCLKSE